MDLTVFEDGEFGFEIGFRISQLQVSQNRDQKVKKWSKVDLSNFKTIFDKHTYLKILDKNTYIPYF